MRKSLLTIPLTLLFVALVAWHAAYADDYVPFTPEELDDLLAPIALYPDPLLAQMLPAATFIDQIDEAARYVGQYGKSADVDDQPWDVSVRALAHYPDVLSMMDQKYDWTVSLGQAYVYQPDDVMDSIQRLRRQALEEGNLVSTAEQQVIDEDGVISIIPVEPDVIYVPLYDPWAVYYEPPAVGFIAFGVGLPIGVWLNRDCDWRHHRIYYHGWQGGGWIGRSRPHIHDGRSIYIDDRFSSIDINRRVTQRSTASFRDEVRVDAQKRSERSVRAAPPAGREQPGRAAQPARVEAPRPAFTETRPAARGENKEVYRGRDIQNTKPASSSWYGGYGTSRDAESYRERGRTSRENMMQFNRTAPAAQPARPGGGRQIAPAPSGRQAPSGGAGAGGGVRRR